jgi:glycosyltransferase involved in cell wall biosynthesis
MNHLIINRDYPPSSSQPGGIGTYVDHISRLLAGHGETVHVISELSPGAPCARESRAGGRLIVHRVPLDEPLPQAPAEDAAVLRAFRDSPLPVQAFAWQAARLAESLIETAAIDVIEAQEYEAPVYFLLLRRALGLAAVRPVPVIVHIHTGTEWVFKHNEWDMDRPDYLPAKRLEDYTIRAADALLCPSRFLARITEDHYQLDHGSVEVMPYPIGDTAVLARDAGTWAHGIISYIGRLEPRKGVREWIEAAVAVAADNPEPRFTLIGGDTVYSGTADQSTREVLQARIPQALRARFTFVDFVPRQQLAAHLRRARMAVVPSRWENFPNTCIEAMSSGLPVLVSPSGGMAEMIEDGRTGWIADGSDARSLEKAFRKALATPPGVLAQMGAAAASAIRILCDNEETVRRHLEFRRRVSMRGCDRSAHVVAASAGDAAHPRAATNESSERGTAAGITLIVSSKHRPAGACVAGIASQTTRPAQVILIVPSDADMPDPFPPDGSCCPWQIVRHPDVTSDRAREEALRIAADGNPLAVVFLDDEWVLAAGYVSAMDHAFRQSPNLGIVAPWRSDNGEIVTALPPAFPYQLASNDAGPCAAFRAAAVEDARAAGGGLAGGDAMWSLANAILAVGWRAAPFPAVLASRQGRVLRARSQSVGIRQAPLASGRIITPIEVLLATSRQRRDLVRRALADPAYVVRWLAWHGRRTIGRIPRRLLAAGRAALGSRVP